MTKKTTSDLHAPPAPWRRFALNAILPAIVLAISTCAFRVHIYTPAKEQHFLTAAENAFTDGRTQVKLSELTNFDWDRVCNLIGGRENMTKAELEEYTKADWTDFYASLPGCFNASDCRNFSRLGLAFIKGNKVVSVLVFDHPNVWINGMAYELADRQTVPLRKDEYKYCRPKDGVYLVREDTRVPRQNNLLSIETK